MGFLDKLLRMRGLGHQGGYGGHGGGHHGGRSGYYPPGNYPQPAGRPCAQCGMANAADARFCQGCGASLVPATAACGSCGAVMNASSRFCPACGRERAPAPGGTR